MEAFTSIMGILAIPIIIGYSIWSTISNRKARTHHIIIKPSEQKDHITMANLILIIPHGKASITDKGNDGLYKVDVTYPANDVLTIAAWPLKAQEGNLAKSIAIEKDIFKSIGSTFVGEDNVGQNAVLLSFSNKNGGLEFALIAFVPTSSGKTELLIELTRTHNYGKKELLEILKNTRSVIANQRTG